MHMPRITTLLAFGLTLGAWPARAQDRAPRPRAKPLPSAAALGHSDMLAADLARVSVLNLDRGALQADVSKLNVAHVAFAAVDMASFGASHAALAAEVANFDMSPLALAEIDEAMRDGVGRLAEPLPPDSWAPADPADSLYRLARRAISDGNFRRAAELFARVHEEYSSSSYAADAYYWHAYALYRSAERGSTSELEEAKALLDEQRERHPRAATRRSGEADQLSTRIEGQLGSRGDSESAERTVQRADGVSRSCPTEDDDERVEALNALLQMDAERAVPILTRVLERRDACSVVLRRKAVFLISQKQSEGVADLLLRTARTDADSEVRQQAVFWLSQVHDERVVDMLQEILVRSDDSDLRDKAIFSLSQHRSERAQQLLREYAGNEQAPSELREKAIIWLGKRRSEENARFLRELYGRLRSDELKEKVQFSISQMRGVGNEQWLLDVALREAEPLELRKKALFWLGQAGTAVQPLIDLYGRMENQEMREQLIFVYSQRRERAAVDKLLDIARNEQNRELRRKAIFWLSQSRDPRVAEFLQQLIEQ